MRQDIFVKGAKENNLKNIDVKIPRNKLVVLTGVSGSGKSTLAFDTIFAEGQRRYMESLSSYARQFLGQMQKPDVELIDGLSPAIAIDQKTTSNNPRSTVGTVTEIYDYLRLLYANIGEPFCPHCGKKIIQQTLDQIVDKIMALKNNTKIRVEAPVVRGKKGAFIRELESYKRSGYVRADIDGQVYLFEDEIELDKNKKHNISIVIDRLIIKEDIRARLTESVEIALKLTEGKVVIFTEDKEMLFSTKYACEDCEISLEELSPRMFSFNNPYGACSECHGLGFKNEIDPNLVLPDKNKSINQGAVNITGWVAESGKMADMFYNALAKEYKFSLNTPVKELSKEIIDIILYGTGSKELELSYNNDRFTGSYHSKFEGLIPNLERRYKETTSEFVKWEIGKLMKQTHCPKCNGLRLRPEVLAIRINGINIAEMCALSVDQVMSFLKKLDLGVREEKIASPIIKEICARLKFLIDVGLNYLTIARSATTLSGGEGQRIRLATQIGSGLMGVLYILDEPSIGLHQRDNAKLLNTLKRLRDLGNTVLVVEHDEETIRTADHIIDIGPYAGEHGGELIAEGTVQNIMESPRSITGKYLSGERSIKIPTVRRTTVNGFFGVRGARQNNLKNIDVDFPLGILTVITGVSGSGKSSLINQILHPALSNKLNRSRLPEGNYDSVVGAEKLNKVIAIDQEPIGRTPRSNPATYTGVFSAIRELFAMTPDAKERGYTAGRFSFNVKGGRCEACGGDGINKIEMYFLPDVYVPCEVCKAKRYNRETLEVKYRDKNIYDILEMRVEEAVEFFKNMPAIYNKIKTLDDVGLGYIKLGQSATTLSGGEAQRVKLATELSKRSTGNTLYILDEPTTGLHMYDVDKLITILQRLVSKGNTVIII
ncbi:MAG: excinuclease ABC subunit UvrA, partial [Clostridia bacterium]